MSILGNDITRFLLPLAAISLVAIPALATGFGVPLANVVYPFTNFGATNIGTNLGRRRKRSVPFQHTQELKEMKFDQEIDILEDFWAQQPIESRKDQVDMIMANYVTCSGIEGTVFDENDQSSVENHCFEHIACLYGNENSPLTNSERNVVAV